MLLKNHLFKMTLSLKYLRGKTSPQEIVFRIENYGNNIPRHDGILKSLKTNEINLRLSQEMDFMMSKVHAQTNRTIRSTISDRVIPEIRTIVSSMSSSGNRDTEASTSPNSQENRERTTGLKTRIIKKDSRFACDLRDTEDPSPYSYFAYIGSFVVVSKSFTSGFPLKVNYANKYFSPNSRDDQTLKKLSFQALY